MAVNKNDIENSLESNEHLINMEESLSKIKDNTNHIVSIEVSDSQHIESLDNSSLGIYQILQDILLDSHNISSHFDNNNSNVSNPSGTTLPIGGRMSVVDEILREIKSFRRETSTALSALNGSPQSGKTFEDLVKEFRDILEAKRQANEEFKNENRLTAKEESEKIRKEKKEKKQRDKEIRQHQKWSEKESKGISAVNTAISTISSIKDANSATNAIIGLTKNLPGIWGQAISGGLSLIKGAFDMYAKQDKLGSEYAREIGGGYYGKRQHSDAINDIFNRNMPLMRQNGIDREEISNSMREYAGSIGRTSSNISDNSILSSIFLKRMKISQEALNTFDTFGKSLNSTSEYFTQLYQSVSKKGLAFKNVTKAVEDNLKNAQKYTFANGLRGLEKMAENSVRFKTNMSEAFTFADKISNLENVIKSGASLSVLGGTFAMNSDPMQMLYESLNDVEALQERMLRMTKGMASFNKEKGILEINPIDKMRLKSASEAMGVSYDEMLSQAMNQGKYSRIESDLRKNRTSFDDETIEYIKNIAELNKNGNSFITLNGKEKAVSSLTQEDKEQIKAEAELKEQRSAANLGDIWQSTTNIGERLDYLVKYLQEKLGVWVYQIFAKFVGNRDSAGSYFLANATPSERDELVRKYGTYGKAKRALKRDFLGEDEILSEYFGGSDNVVKFNSRFIGSKANIDDKNDYFDELLKVAPKKANGIVDGNYHVNGGVPALYNGQLIEIEKGETLFGKDILRTYGTEFLTNIKQHNVPVIKNVKGNFMPPLNVAPTNLGENLNGGNIKIDPIKIDIGGKIDLSLNGKNKEFDINNIPEKDMDRLTKAIYAKVYNEIMLKINKVYNKEKNPFIGV